MYDTLVSDILSGHALPSAAMGRKDLYDALNTGASGRLPFLGTSTKIEAGGSAGVLSAVLYMVPADLSGREACSGRSDGCSAACLAESTGKMSFPNAQRARRRRHASFYADRRRFLADLHAEVAKHERKAKRAGKAPAIRLNGTTDLPWHRMAYVGPDGVSYPSLHAAFPNVHFYEYTKRPRSLQGAIPSNLSLTFSLSARADAEGYATEYLLAGHGVAVVADHKRHVPPPTFSIGGASYPTLDGDAHDARFLDPASHIVMLAAKGRAKTDTTGFVQKVA